MQIMMGWLTGALALALLVAARCQAGRASNARDRTRCDLAQVGRHFQVDKFNPYHNYQHLYCELFQPIRERKLRMLEIGLGCGHHVAGASAKAWNKYFADLDYFTMDYLPQGNMTQLENCVRNIHAKFPKIIKQAWLGDQSDRQFLKKIISESEPFDIIIDDGGHDEDQLLASFEMLWPHVAPGGYYIMEDLFEAGRVVPMVANWILRLGTGVDTARKGGDLATSVPRDARSVGCSFLICFVRKNHPSRGETMPAIWGEKYLESNHR